MSHHCWWGEQFGPHQGCHGDDDGVVVVVVAYSGTARYPRRVSASCPHQADCSGKQEAKRWGGFSDCLLLECPGVSGRFWWVLVDVR